MIEFLRERNLELLKEQIDLKEKIKSLEDKLSNSQEDFLSSYMEGGL